MRKTKRVISLFTALFLLLSCTTGALAASYTVSNWDELTDAFADNSGEDVTIDLVNDIEAGALGADEGITYTIGTSNNSRLFDVTFHGKGTVVVNTDILDGLCADDSVDVTVYGDVSGKNGDPNDVDYSDPKDYSDGDSGVMVYDEATVTIYGDVTGGDGYGTIGFAGAGIYATDNSTVVVYGDVTGGNVTADPETPNAENYYGSYAGEGIDMDSTATVTVYGDVKGGSTNGDGGYGGYGIQLEFEDECVDDVGSLTVTGSVSGGSAPANGTAGSGLELDDDASYYNDEGTFIGDVPVEDMLLPTISLGSCDSIEFNDFDEDEQQVLLGKIVYTGVEKEDTFWQEVYWKLFCAAEGEEITVDAGARTLMPAYIMDAIRANGAILVIEWDGGEDIVIREAIDLDTAEILLSDLAELVK